MKLDLTKKSHKIILFALLVVPTLIMGIIWTAYVQNQADATIKEEPKIENTEGKESDSPDSSPSEELELTEEQKQIESENIPGSEYITDEDKAIAQNVAEKFAQAYGNYDSEKPLDFVHNAKPYMSEIFYNEWDKNPPRRPLALIKSEVDSYEAYPIDTADKYTLMFNVVLQQKTVNSLEDKDVPLETSLIIALKKTYGEWKVEGVNVSNG
ncbi:Uncharacterised protein [Chlamydia trachomatis]|nr:Uncharacterised protein [Chlamydia trachomatis]